ncbi:MAG: hypothetical protein EB023_10355 [Flavobacteriia bacterium]|nr:hypothetical protein [Flavobacteriia bacterium]
MLAQVSLPTIAGIAQKVDRQTHMVRKDWAFALHLQMPLLAQAPDHPIPILVGQVFHRLIAEVLAAPHFEMVQTKQGKQKGLCFVQAQFLGQRVQLQDKRVHTIARVLGVAVIIQVAEVLGLDQGQKEVLFHKLGLGLGGKKGMERKNTLSAQISTLLIANPCLGNDLTKI